MNRRDFLKAIVGVGAVATVPASMLPAWKRVEVDWKSMTPGTYGAIDRATFSCWRNQQVGNGVGLDSEVLKREMRDLYNRCSRGGNPPNAMWYMT